MKPKGVLMSGVNVRAILADRKNQTRRIMKPQPTFPLTEVGLASGLHATKGYILQVTYRAYPNRGTARWAFCECPYNVGTVLYVKETHYRWGKWVKSGLTKKGNQAWRFKVVPYSGKGPGILWAADCPVVPIIKRNKVGWHKRPSIFMPRWASRIWLEVTAVRVERLNSITAADAIAEGLEPGLFGKTFRAPGYALDRDAVGAYEALWESINGKGSWAANPFVFAYTFKRTVAPE